MINYTQLCKSSTSYKWSWLAWSAELRLFKHTYLVRLPCNLLGEERFILYMPLSSVLLPSVILYIGIWINNQWYTCDILSVPSRKRICLRMFFLWAQPSAFQVWNNQLKLNASWAGKWFAMDVIFLCTNTSSSFITLTLE